MGGAHDPSTLALPRDSLVTHFVPVQGKLKLLKNYTIL